MNPSVMSKPNFLRGGLLTSSIIVALSNATPIMLSPESNDFENELSLQPISHQPSMIEWPFFGGDKRCSISIALATFWTSLTKISIRTAFRPGIYAGFTLTALTLTTAMSFAWEDSEVKHSK